MARALAAGARAKAKKRRSVHMPAGHRSWLVPGFYGDLFFTPDILPVCFDFRRLIREVHLRPEEMLRLDPRQFEELVNEIWIQLGYVTELTARTKDGGRDIIAVKQAEANVRFLIECKRYNPYHKVGVQLVRSLYGVKVHEKATMGILATTSSFTKGARLFFNDHTWELEPRDFSGVVDWVKLAMKRAE
jgi:Restriction endonuclease